MVVRMEGLIRRAGCGLLIFFSLTSSSYSSAVMAKMSCAPFLAVFWVSDYTNGRSTSFRLAYGHSRQDSTQHETVEVRDPHKQVDLTHPFELALTDPAARERFTFVEESLKKRGVKKKVFITHREVRIVNSIDRPELFSDIELRNPIPVVLSFTQKVDENINGTIHGVISELYLEELEVVNDDFRASVAIVVNDIVRRAQENPLFRDRDPEQLRKQCKKIAFMRTVWKAKHIFYEWNLSIRPEYAAKWSADPEDQEMNRQLVQFYSNTKYEPVDRDFAEFVVYEPTPGIELSFFFTPPL